MASIQDRRAGNIADKTASTRSAGWTCTTEVDDGHVVHAPVGSFAANAFGLHDVLGNVWEWCEDRYSSYEQPARPGDGLRDEPGSRNRVLRGGSFSDPALSARSAVRAHTPRRTAAATSAAAPPEGITEPPLRLHDWRPRQAPAEAGRVGLRGVGWIVEEKAPGWMGGGWWEG